MLGSLRDQRQSLRERASPCWLCSIVILSTSAILVSDKKHVSLEGLPYDGKILNWLENWFILGSPVSIVEASVMKLPIKLEFNSDPVFWAGWELVLFTKTEEISMRKEQSQPALLQKGTSFSVFGWKNEIKISIINGLWQDPDHGGVTQTNFSDSSYFHLVDAKLKIPTPNRAPWISLRHAGCLWQPGGTRSPRRISSVWSTLWYLFYWFPIDYKLLFVF